jgi:hypothetical protein
MKSNATKRLLRANLIAAILCLLFLLWQMIYFPDVATLWSRPEGAKEQIQRAGTLEQLVTTFEMAVSDVSRSRTRTDQFFGVVMLVQFVALVFLCINVFRIGRLHRQVSKDDNVA